MENVEADLDEVQNDLRLADEAVTATASAVGPASSGGSTVFTRVTVSGGEPAKRLVADSGVTKAYLVIHNNGSGDLIIGQNSQLTVSTPDAYHLMANEVVWGTFNINKVFVTADVDTVVDVAVSDAAGLLP